MTEKYEITKEAILAMAEKCPDAKSVLKAGFPEAFKKKDKYFDFSRAELIFNAPPGMMGGDIQISEDKRGLVLDGTWNWILVHEKRSRWKLIPTRKD